MNGNGSVLNVYVAKLHVGIMTHLKAGELIRSKRNREIKKMPEKIPEKIVEQRYRKYAQGRCECCGKELTMYKRGKTNGLRSSSNSIILPFSSDIAPIIFL